MKWGLTLLPAPTYAASPGRSPLRVFTPSAASAPDTWHGGVSVWVDWLSGPASASACASALPDLSGLSKPVFRLLALPEGITNCAKTGCFRSEILRFPGSFRHSNKTEVFMFARVAPEESGPSCLWITGILGAESAALVRCHFLSISRLHRCRDEIKRAVRV